MGKNLKQQARGKGTPTYRAPSFRYKGKTSLKSLKTQAEAVKGEIKDIIKCQGHSAPLMEVVYEDGEKILAIAPEGMKVGDEISVGDDVELAMGNTMKLKDIPEGTSVFNIEAMPGDGGKFVRSSGGFARIATRLRDRVVVELPSRKMKHFMPDCRAVVGVIAGGGRTDKPLLSAGKTYYKMKAKNKKYPVISGNAQNAVDHPLGNKRSSRSAKNKPISRHAPPGRKVGKIAARKTGTGKGRK